MGILCMGCIRRADPGSSEPLRVQLRLYRKRDREGVSILGEGPQIEPARRDFAVDSAIYRARQDDDRTHFFPPLFSGGGQINFRKWSFVSLPLPISLKKVHVAISSSLQGDTSP